MIQRDEIKSLRVGDQDTDSDAFLCYCKMLFLILISLFNYSFKQRHDSLKVQIQG